MVDLIELAIFTDIGRTIRTLDHFEVGLARAPFKLTALANILHMLVGDEFCLLLLLAVLVAVATKANSLEGSSALVRVVARIFYFHVMDLLQIGRVGSTDLAP